MGDGGTHDLVVIGGGAAGVLLVAHLATTVHRPIRVAVVNPGAGRLGAGTAYATTDPLHRLNVRAGSLSAWIDDPGHFVSWLSATSNTVTRADEFVPRARYGAYLAAVAADAAGGPRVRLEHVRCRAVDLARTPAGWCVLLDSGRVLAAPAVVLATGNGSPSTGWVPGKLRHHPRFVPDPWRPDALDAIGPADPVLIAGSGLTAVDVALSLGRGERTLVMTSRHGWLPEPHSRLARPPYPLDPDALPTTLDAARALIRRQVTRSRAATGDWRPAIDGLRPDTQRIWRSWSTADQARFLRVDRRRWDTARHRMAPEAAHGIAELRGTGQLRLERGDAAPAATAALDAGAWVVNATGPQADPRHGGDGLLRTLLAAGVVAAGPLGLGLATDAAGRVRDGAGVTVPGLYTLGGTRVGQLWESTAIPELRAQAYALAHLLAATPATPPPPRPESAAAPPAEPPAEPPAAAPGEPTAGSPAAPATGSAGRRTPARPAVVA